jgi:hypothetical protein
MIFFLFDNSGFVDVGRPLWREDGSVFYSLQCTIYLRFTCWSYCNESSAGSFYILFQFVYHQSFTAACPVWDLRLSPRSQDCGLQGCDAMYIEWEIARLRRSLLAFIIMKMETELPLKSWCQSTGRHILILSSIWATESVIKSNRKFW